MAQTISPETLMQLGLYDYVWGDNWYPKAMQAAEEAEKNREAQKSYNEYLKEYDRAKLAEEKAKRESIAKATAEAKVTELLDGYGYKTPQQRDLIDRQINVAVADGGLDPEAVKALKELSVKNAEDEMLERSAKNAVLDPIKSKIRLHGAYSADPNWKKLSPDYIKDIQSKVGAKADGVFGKKTEAAINKWNAEHADDQITAPNELEQILDEIDQLRYVHNDAEKQFSPAELDELRKMVYGGEDPSLKNKQDWSDFYKNMAQQNAKEKAEQRKKDKARLAELQKAIDANYNLSAEEEAEYKTLKAKGL